MEITGKARLNTAILDNEIKLKTRNTEVIPDIYCEKVGEKDISTGEIKSYFKSDRADGTTEKLDYLLSMDVLIEKPTTLIDSLSNRREVILYYYPYDIQESTKFIPTYTEESIGDAYVMNGHYHATYEVLFGCEDYTLRLTMHHNAVNVSMFDWIEDIRSQAEDVIDQYEDIGEDNPFKDIIEHSEYGPEIMMFNYVGELHWINIESVDELMSMIVSIRQLGCEFIEEY